MSKNKKNPNHKAEKLKDPNYKIAKEQFQELNKEFYEGFLNEFYTMKVINLLSLITNSEKSIKTFSEDSVEIGKIKIDPSKEELQSTSLIKYAKAELAMSYFHCLETFLRLFLAHAKMPGCPWLELANISLNKYKKELEKISEGKFENLNNELNANETIIHVFTGDTELIQENREDFISGYKEWLTFAASQLLENYEYNSFKHGLAIFPAQNGLKFSNSKENLNLEAHGEVIENLVKVDDNDRKVWAKQNKFIKYDEIAAFITWFELLMQSILNVGKVRYLQTKEDIQIWQAHQLSPNDIREIDKDSSIRINGFTKTLIYYE